MIDQYIKINGECITYGNSYNTIIEAKIACTKDGKCVGVRSKLEQPEFTLCSSISVQDKRQKTYAVFKKDGTTGLAIFSIFTYI